MKRLLSVVLTGIVVVGLAVSAVRAETPGVRKVAPAAKAKILSGLDARMLNPQPLPPRELSAYYLRFSRFSRVLLNPQPLPPRSSPLILRVVK